MGSVCCVSCEDDFVSYSSESSEESSLLNERIAVVQSDFQSPDYNILLKKSDRVKILSKINNDWIKVTNLTTGESGTIPRNFLEIENSLEAKPWYFGDASRLYVETQLLTQNQPDGTFLIRNPNTARDSAFILNVKYSKEGETCVAYYKIKTDSTNNYYITPQQIFPTIDLLLQYYQNDTSGQLVARLTNPCEIKQVPPCYDLHPCYANNLEIARHELCYLQCLGSGISSTVYLAKHKNNIEVAVKILKQNQNIAEFIKEINVMKRIRHKNLVNLYGICIKDAPVLIIQEYVKNGSLDRYMSQVQLEPMERIYIAFQIADGMSYLEKKKIVHRDLAARNVLIGENLCVKICDFGLSRLLLDNIYDIQNFLRFLPTKWTAPEAFTKAQFSTKSDVWSFGILMIELYTNCEPLYRDIGNLVQLLEYLKMGKRIENPPTMPRNIYNVVLNCWNWNPDDRPNFYSLKHYFDQFIL